jgi:hypothetical protein
VSFSGLKINGIKLSTSYILQENLVQSAFQQTLRDEFTFQQYNNRKHKAKSTLEMFTKKTLYVPVWPSYIFDLNLLENLWKDVKMVVHQGSTNNQPI